MSSQIVEISDRESGARARVLVSLGFNCFSWRPVLDDGPREMLWADAGFDNAEGLRSAVVRLGESRAIVLAKLLHGITIPALALFGYGAGFGAWYYAGLIVATGILAYEHHLVRPGDLSRLDAAFFTMNGVMSVVVFSFGLLDRLVRP